MTLRLQSAPEDEDGARLETLLAEAARLARSSRNDGSPRKSSPRVALTEACAIARKRELRPEQVIIMLKQAWMSVSASDHAISKDTQAELDDTVTACIEEYFAEPPRAAKP